MTEKLLKLALESNQEGEALAAFKALRRKSLEERKALTVEQNTLKRDSFDTKVARINEMVAYQRGVEDGRRYVIQEAEARIQRMKNESSKMYELGLKLGKQNADNEKYFQGKRDGYEQAKGEATEPTVEKKEQGPEVQWGVPHFTSFRHPRF